MKIRNILIILSSVFILSLLVMFISYLNTNQYTERLMQGAIFVNIVLFFAFVFLIWRLIIKPVTLCETFAKQIAQGNFDAALTFTSGSEIGSLSDSLRSMVTALRGMPEDLKTRERLLSETNQHIQTVLDSMPFGMSMWDKNAQSVGVNQAAINFFKVSSKQEYIDRFQDFWPKYQPNGRLSTQEAKKHIDRAIKDGSIITDWMHVASDGEMLPCELTCVRIDYRGDYYLVAYFRDLREQYRMMREIESGAKENEFQLAKLEVVIKAASIGLWELEITENDPMNPDNPMIWSDDCIRLLGYERAGDLPNRMQSYFEHIHPEDLEKNTEAYFGHLLDKTGKTPFNSELRLRKKNGGYTFFRNSGEFLRDESGNPTRMLGTLIDITEIKNLIHEAEMSRLEAEAAARENEVQLARMNLVINATEIGLWDIEITEGDPLGPGNTVIWSDEFRRLLGFENETDFPNLVKSSNDRIHPDDFERATGAFVRHLLDKTGKTPYDVEYRIRKKSGEYAHCRVCGEAIRDDGGNPLRVVGSLIDMTWIRTLISDMENQRMEAELASKEKELQLTKLNLTIKASMIGLWEMVYVESDPLNSLNFMWSDECFQILGYDSAGDRLNPLKNFAELVHPDDLAPTGEALLAHLLDKTGKTPYDVEYRVMKGNGSYAYLRCTGEAVRDDGGNPLSLVGTMFDMTEIKRLINEAETQRKEAEAANRAKSEFLSHMSHELRTPMNAVLGTTEMQLLSEDLSPETEEAFNVIYNSGNLLVNIINDLLDLSRIEEGKLELMPFKYDIPSLLFDTMQLSIIKYESKPIEFKLKVDKNTPLELFGDELRIKQILNNILSNAFKYTEEGEVELSVHAEPDEAKAPSGLFLVFRISDTGQGMTAEQIAALYDRYVRFNTEMNRGIAGTGLGMSITKSLVDVMGGEIHVESRPGKGSVFTVRLPQEGIGTAVCGDGLSEHLNSSRFQSIRKLRKSQIMHEYMPYGRVLIVDDVESNLYVAKGIMTPYGMEIETVVSGFEAVDKIKNGNVYDIVFMDHMMPHMDGIEAAGIIRGMGYTRPVVALTANTLMGQAEMFLASGFDGFISKPIDIRELNSVLNRMIRDRQPPEVIEAARREQARQKNTRPLSSQVQGDKLAAVASRDIKNTLIVLEDVLSKIRDSGGEAVNLADINLFTTTVHGIKSGLASIGHAELSAAALKLEKAGANKEVSVISAETPAFTDALRKLLKKFEVAKAGGPEELSRDDMTLLLSKLSAIKTACAEYKKRDIKNTLEELKQKTWPRAISDVLDDIYAHLLHGEFKKIITAAEKTTDLYRKV